MRAILGIKSFRSTQIILSGIELMHMMMKGQFDFIGSNASVVSLYQLVSLNMVLIEFIQLLSIKATELIKSVNND